MFLVIGGKGGNNDNDLNLDVFNLAQSEWSTLNTINRFRHTSWIMDGKLFIHGGFEPNRPNIPTNNLFRIDLHQALSRVPALERLLTNATNENMDEENIQQNMHNWRTYEITPVVIISMPRVNGDAHVMQQVPFTQLQNEPNRLVNNAEANVNQNHNRTALNESLYSVILSQLLKPTSWTPPPNYSFAPRKGIVEKLCDEVIKLLVSSDIVVKLRPPVKIFGSIHGQYRDLMRMFAQHGSPVDPTEPQSDIEGLDYLFLGNYVGRGKYSLETICLLFALKLKYPDQIHLLRGCYEDIRINKIYGKTLLIRSG